MMWGPPIFLSKLHIPALKTNRSSNKQNRLSSQESGNLIKSAKPNATSVPLTDGPSTQSLLAPILIRPTKTQSTMNYFNRARSPLSSLLSRRAEAAVSSSLRSLPKTSIPLRSPPIPPSFNFNRTYSFYRSRPQTEIYQFRRRSGPRWYQDPRKLVIAVVVSGGAIVVIYFGNLETVPYTKRTHLVLLSSSTERQLGESQFKQIKESVKGKILPPLHPDSVRIRLISNQIIKALQHGLKRDELKWYAFVGCCFR